jgi:zinc transporter, ZIP family
VIASSEFFKRHMPDQFQLIAPYILAATGVGVVAGILAFFWAPGLKTRNAIQHFAAGVVLGAVASDLIPQVEKSGKPAGILAGFAAGGIAMIFIKWWVLRFEKKEEKKSQLPIGLAAAAGVDTLIDGGVISAGFSTGERLGSLLALALAVELFFLNLSVGSEFHKLKSRRWTALIATTAIASLLLVGAVGGFFLLRGLQPTSIAIVLSFGAAALIYLIAEELLVESIEGETIFSVVMLFAGFLVVLAFKLLSQHPAST